MAKLPPSRAVVEVVSPVVDGGSFPAKASVGEPVPVIADVFGDGHDAVDAALRWRHAPVGGDHGSWHETPMTYLVNDRWEATFVADRLGRHQFEIVAWSDHVETWRHGAEAKVAAGVDVTLERLDGEQIVAALTKRAKRSKHTPADDLDTLDRLLETVRTGTDDQLAAALHEPVWATLSHRYHDRSPKHTSERYAIDVDRALARCGAWYEFFPRSSWNDDDPDRHGTLRDAIDRLDHVAGLGFDVLYLPPIHPIGFVNRKGRNNTTEAAPDDVGVPWGISDHYAVHPELGTHDDVRALAAAGAERGVELAIDIAFQCTPDHVWVTEHPEWFRHRADGSIQYAENPPKKYQDIYPIDFETSDWRALWDELANVIRFWIGHGIKIFRVDNPHTKAFAFWEWALGEIRAEHPDTIFLAEAFTRPRVMQRLAKIGFNQGYTYFTWRKASWELRDYFEELSAITVDYFRPNVWPNTPDILTDQLQTGNRAMFQVRAILAATLSASWGVYGPAFELMQHQPLRPGSEEYLDSEKYQRRHWVIDDPQSLAPLLRRLNEVRRANPPLQHLRTLRFHEVDSAAMLCYSKTDPNPAVEERSEPILVVANVDADHGHAGMVHVSPGAFGLGLGDDDQYDVVDLLDEGSRYRWTGWHNYAELAPGQAHVFAVRRPS